MKSTIRVELGTENKPVIRMRVYPSDDVRDVLFQQFKEGFGHESNLCYAAIDSGFTGRDGLSAVITIEPLPPRSHYICLQRVEEIYKCLYEQHPEVHMTVGGGTIGFYINNGSGPGVELNRDDLVNMNIVDLFREVTGAIESIVTSSKIVVPAGELGNKLPSRCQIEDAVATDDIFDGEIVAVKFTIGKVYYDILDKLSGKVAENVDSCNIIVDNIVPQVRE